MVTIYEVATRAGVSPATVSRVVNGLRVSEEKAQLVRKAAAELNFTPNRAARNLRRQNSEVIAMVVPDIENPYFTSMVRAVEDVAQAAGFSVVVGNSDGDPVKEAKYLDIAVSENMAGAIVAPASERTDLSELLARGRPVIVVDRSTTFDVDVVMMSNREGGRAAAQALTDAGYRRIACITGPESVVTAQERADGWNEVVAPLWPDSRTFLRYSDFRVDGGRASMEELLTADTPPDAVVATNNLIGVGVLQVLGSRGLTPPKFGVAVVGDLPFTTLPPGAVTIVRLPVRHMGTTAAKMLMERLDGDRQPSRTVVLRNELQPADVVDERV